MQWLASLLMILGTSLGVYGAASAYYVPIDAPDAQIAGLTLNDDAGARVAGRSLVPIAQRGAILDAPTLTELRNNAAGAPGESPAWKYARVKEFAWSRWPGKWLACAGIALLGVGAVLARETRGTIVASEDGAVVAINLASVAQLSAEIDSLVIQARARPTGAAKWICDSTDGLQKRWIMPLLRSQAHFMSKHGVGRAAETVTSLAAVERNLNRAWSAAADGYLDEATEALGNAGIYCQATLEKVARLEESAKRMSNE